MKLLVLLAVLTWGPATMFQGQEPEPELPASETQDVAAQAPVNQSSPSASPSPPPQLIPSDVLSPRDRAAEPQQPAPAMPSLPQLDEAFKEKPLSYTALIAEARAHWRIVKNEVSNRKDVKEALQAALQARTDLEKRRLMRRYYEISFAQMVELEPRPEFKAYLNDRKSEALRALDQPRVRPTPTPSPSPPAAAARR